jgi:hypothetical protein
MTVEMDNHKLFRSDTYLYAYGRYAYQAYNFSLWGGLAALQDGTPQEFPQFENLPEVEQTAWIDMARDLIDWITGETIVAGTGLKKVGNVMFIDIAKLKELLK